MTNILEELLNLSSVMKTLRRAGLHSLFKLTYVTVFTSDITLTDGRLLVRYSPRKLLVSKAYTSLIGKKAI